MVCPHQHVYRHGRVRRLSTEQLLRFPAIQAKYGEQLPDGSWEIPAAWQAGLSNGVIVGEIIGLFLNGWISEAIGYRYTVMGCLLLIIGFTTIFFTAQTVVHLLVAEILCGIPWGVFQTLTITYACEVCPVALRGYCTFIQTLPPNTQAYIN
jgi:SP family general alpha glucoside:H+ symporter-like MFS transporter